MTFCFPCFLRPANLAKRGSYIQLIFGVFSSGLQNCEVCDYQEFRRAEICSNGKHTLIMQNLTVSRPFIWTVLARRDSVLDLLSISSMIP